MKTGFALIGAGIFGERHAQAFSRHPAVDFVSVCDLNAARAEEIAGRYGARRHTTDFREVLADPEVTAVSIATPDHLHREVAVAAAQAGKHLLVEKPLATTVEDAEAIVAAARQGGVKLVVDFHNRVNPPMVNARDAIRRGEIGKPVYFYTRLSNTAQVATQMLKWASHSSALWFLASHMVDVVRWMLGDEVRRVTAIRRDGILKEMGIDTADFHLVTLEFKNGAVAVFEHAWILPTSHPTLKDLKMEILGSKGAIYIDGSHNRALEVYGQRASFPDLLAPPTGTHLTGFVLDSIACFIDTITEDAPPLATGEEGLEVTRLLCAIERAAELGLPLEL
ncbi:MAG: Gfo/Idh/MocA family oxidoreductase [Meiothermus sp.]|nr:Gfo/Idh/MocA family oxidoreductase [Meiothermus sp.]